MHFVPNGDVADLLGERRSTADYFFAAPTPELGELRQAWTSEAVERDDERNRFRRGQQLGWRVMFTIMAFGLSMLVSGLIFSTPEAESLQIVTGFGGSLVLAGLIWLVPWPHKGHCAYVGVEGVQWCSQRDDETTRILFGQAERLYRATSVITGRYGFIGVNRTYRWLDAEGALVGELVGRTFGDPVDPKLARYRLGVAAEEVWTERAYAVARERLDAGLRVHFEAGPQRIEVAAEGVWVYIYGRPELLRVGDIEAITWREGQLAIVPLANGASVLPDGAYVIDEDELHDLHLFERLCREALGIAWRDETRQHAQEVRWEAYAEAQSGGPSSFFEPIAFGSTRSPDPPEDDH